FGEAQSASDGPAALGSVGLPCVATEVAAVLIECPEETGLLLGYPALPIFVRERRGDPNGLLGVAAAEPKIGCRQVAKHLVVPHDNRVRTALFPRDRAAV